MVLSTGSIVKTKQPARLDAGIHEKTSNCACCRSNLSTACNRFKSCDSIFRRVRRNFVWSEWKSENSCSEYLQRQWIRNDSLPQARKSYCNERNSLSWRSNQLWKGQNDYHGLLHVSKRSLHPSYMMIFPRLRVPPEFVDRALTGTRLSMEVAKQVG